MTSLLGNLFPKKSINEPGLDLNDPRWKELEGGYWGSYCDASVTLRRLEQATTITEANEIYKELWDELHHQGDIGIASYYAVPHLVRIANITQLLDYNVFGLVTLIEVLRHQKRNPEIPKALLPAYTEALGNLGELAKSAMNLEWSSDLTFGVLAAIAVSKGQINIAKAILNLDDDIIDDLLTQYG